MDDLLDLDWSKQSNANSGNGSQQSLKPTSAVRSNVGSSSYNFDALTRSMPTNGNTGRQQQQQIPSKQTTNSSSGNDAFSSLLGFGNSGTSNNNTTLTMAERLKQSQGSSLGFASQSKSASVINPAKQKADSAWDGLDDFIGASNTKSSINGQNSARINHNPSTLNSTAKKNTDDDIWNFGGMSSTIPSKPKSAPSQNQSHRNSPVPAKKSASKDPFDFSEFEDPADFQSSALGGTGNDEKPTRHKSEDTLFNQTNNRQSPSPHDDEGDDSILGSLSRPARPLASTYEEPTEERIIPPSSTIRIGTVSPPPHIIGQVVEMGFSPQQARDALARTTGGQDVQAALELLLHGSQNNSRAGDGEERDRRLAMRLQKEEHSRQPNRMRANDDSVLGRSRARAGFDVDSEASRSSTPTDWQRQADQLYAQASELGTSMFSKANALWATAKTQAQRAIDEHAGGSGAGSGQSSGRASPASNSDRAKSRRWAVPSRDGGARKDWQGKPKWMIDAEANEGEGEEITQKGEKKSTFKDDDGEVVEEAPPFFERSKAAQQAGTNGKQQQRAENNLWGDASGDNIQRQERPSNIIQSSQRKAAAQPTAPSPSTRNKPQTAISKRHRNLVQDDITAVQTASQHKQRGNELFKRGAYGEAEAAYTIALGALEANPSSIRRVVILNNRANARLKNGDAKGTLDDTMSVLRLIVVQEGEKSSPFLLFRPSQENPLPLPEYEDVNLREAYAKALLRRAQAEESLERWDPALSVWSLLEKYEREEGSGTNGVSNMRAAKEGRGRCDKMLKGGDVSAGPSSEIRPNKPVSNPRVRAAAASAVAKAEAQVKERLRAENAAAAQEEATKDSLRDSIEGKILAWKTGKENNVRALLASLHDVVWPGLGWKKVGMHELVMDNQVKKVYMRAIGRLHPDKLTPKSNTIEERMLGGAVFSVLNDAWSSIQTK